MNKQLEHYNVTFVGDYFTAVVPIQLDRRTEDSDYIVLTADVFIRHMYGWSPLEHATVSVEVERD